MKRISFLLSAVCLLIQVPLMSQTPEQLMVQQQFFNHYGKIYQKGVTAPGLSGPRFLFDEWKPMKIKTKDFEVDLASVKINLYASVLEVLYEGAEKFITPKEIEYVSFKEAGITRKFVPAQNYSGKEITFEGFMEEAGQGPVRVLLHHYTGIKEPGPSANIVGGPTGNVIVKASKMYIFENGKLTGIKNKKQFTKYFRGKSKKAEQLMKEKKTDFKDPYQLYEVLKLMRE